MIRKIQADYDQLAQIAADFSNEADMVDQLMLSIGRLVDDLCGGGWIGRGAGLFYDEMDNEILPALHRLMDALQTASSATLQINQIMHEAEETASQLFALSGVAAPPAVQQGSATQTISQINQQSFDDAQKIIDNLRA